VMRAAIALQSLVAVAAVAAVISLITRAWFVAVLAGVATPCASVRECPLTDRPTRR
jgi:hypothetical protein